MKKAIFMGICFLVFAFGSMSYMNYLTSGKMNLPFNKFFQDGPTSVIDVLQQKAESVSEDVSASVKTTEPQKIYKWQDEYGQWHYGNQPPENITNAESLTINQNQNIMDAVKEPESAAVQTETVTTEPKKVTTPNPYSPEQVKKAIEDAQNVQNLINERFESQKKMLEGAN